MRGMPCLVILILCGIFLIPTKGFSASEIPDYLQKRIDELIPQLGDDEWEIREKATDELIQIGPIGRASIEAALENPDAEIRQRARQILSILKWKEAFLKRLNEFIDQLRKGALQNDALFQQIISFLSLDESVFLLLDLLKDPSQNPSVRQQIANQLGNVRQVSLKPIIPELLEVWKKERDTSVKAPLIRTLGREGKDERVMSVLIEALKDSDRNIRTNAIRAAGDLGDNAVLPELFKLLKDRDNNIRYQVVQILNKFKPEATKEELFKALKEEKTGYVKARIIQLLAGWRDKRLLPEIFPILETATDRQILYASLYALQQYPDDPSVTPHLLKLLKKDDPNLRNNVLNTIRKRKDKAAVPELLKLLEAENDFSSFTNYLNNLEAIANQKFFPKTMPPELKASILKACREWAEKNQ